MEASNSEFSNDRKSFDELWKIVIEPTIQDYANRYAAVCCAHNAKESIWKKYVFFNSHCKKTYMEDSARRLDRHKVCACYMYAIISANVLSSKLADSSSEEKYLALNENLAITTGMSLLSAFIRAAIDSNQDLSDQQKAIYTARVEKGIVFPECNHGIYRDNLIAELHFTYEENAYNILALANILFLLEIHTLQVDAIHKQK